MYIWTTASTITKQTPLGWNAIAYPLFILFHIGPHMIKCSLYWNAIQFEYFCLGFTSRLTIFNHFGRFPGFNHQEAIGRKYVASRKIIVYWLRGCIGIQHRTPGEDGNRGLAIKSLTLFWTYNCPFLWSWKQSLEGEFVSDTVTLFSFSFD